MLPFQKEMYQQSSTTGETKVIIFSWEFLAVAEQFYKTLI